jgi:hypothetical protein
MAHRRKNRLVQRNVQHIDVWTKVEHLENLGVPVNQDLGARFQEVLMPLKANRFTWTNLPLAERLGVPLQYVPLNRGPNRIANSFVKIMSVQRDPMRRSGFSFGDYFPIRGSVMVIRNDGYALQGENIEALAEYVGTKLPHIEHYAGIGVGHYDNDPKTFKSTQQWQEVANREAFVNWWFEWKKAKTANGDANYDSDSSYADLQCPISDGEREREKQKGVVPRLKAKAAKLKNITGCDLM